MKGPLDLDFLPHSLKPEHLHFENPGAVTDAFQGIFAVVVGKRRECLVAQRGLDCGPGHRYSVRSHDASLRLTCGQPEVNQDQQRTESAELYHRRDSEHTTFRRSYGTVQFFPDVLQ